MTVIDLIIRDLTIRIEANKSGQLGNEYNKGQKNFKLKLVRVLYEFIKFEK